jgi:hypothetical protein
MPIKKAKAEVVSKATTKKTEVVEPEVKVVEKPKLYCGKEFSVKDIEINGKKVKEVSLADGSIEMCEPSDFEKRVKEK